METYQYHIGNLPITYSIFRILKTKTNKITIENLLRQRLFVLLFIYLGQKLLIPKVLRDNKTALNTIKILQMLIRLHFNQIFTAKFSEKIHHVDFNKNKGGRPGKYEKLISHSRLISMKNI